MTTATIIENFERFEVKFWAPRLAVDTALDALAEVMKPDEAGLREGASQINTSLYLDSPHATFFEQHVSGSPDRLKLRVRYYGETPQGVTFFEIKRRQTAVVTKRRSIVPLQQAAYIVTHLTEAWPIQNDILESFQYLTLHHHARPHLLVKARREALRSAEGTDVRITVDSNIAWQPARAHQPLVPQPGRWRPLTCGRQSDPTFALVEVKFRTARPCWLAELMSRLGPWRVSFSKYIAACLDARTDPFLLVDAA